jgi:hypothetical protein
MNADFPNFKTEINLSLEQKFKIKMFEESIQKMQPEEARSLLLEASKLLMIKDNLIKCLIQKEPLG